MTLPHSGSGDSPLLSYRGAVKRFNRLRRSGHDWISKTSRRWVWPIRRRTAAVWIAGVPAIGTGVWGVLNWWPPGDLFDRWIDRGDQLASIISMIFTAAGLWLALLVRRQSASPIEREAETLARVQAGGLSAPVLEPAGRSSTVREGAEAHLIPRQLPRDAAWFTGRDTEVKQLLAMAPDPERAPAVVISAIDGMGGIGKTALAVYAGHRMAGRYPDGQLFLDLHGYTESVTPVAPADALDRLLRALGVPGERIPIELDDRAALWRSVLAGRRMLIVLDNAASEEQVAPALPGAPGSLVLVTSRRRLAGLEATHTLSLDTLPVADAVTLFVRTVGLERLANDPKEIIVEAVELCGRLPLAIRVAAARLKHHSVWSVADLVARLRDQDQRLIELEDGRRSVTAALELSYQELPGAQQRMYRLLGIHPGPDIDPYAAAALADSTLRLGSKLLDHLLDAHLVQEPAPGRYLFHDLVRAHATHAAVRDEPDQQAALTRLLDYYRHTASVAMDIAHPYELERRPRVPPTGTSSPDLSAPAPAVSWLDIELPNLLAVAGFAADAGWPEHTGHFSGILRGHLRTRGLYGAAETIHNLALTAAQATGHHASELDALLGLADVYRRQGRYEQALNQFGRALDVARTIGDRAGELDALNGLGWVYQRQGHNEQALDQYGIALDVARMIGDRAGELDASNGLGYLHLLQGRYKQAFEQYRVALELARATGNRAGELLALHSLGNVYRRQGRYEQAADHYTQALEIARATGNRAGELHALHSLGNVYRQQGRYEQAADHYTQALEIARATGNRVGVLFTLTGLAWIYRLQGRHKEAANHYNEVLGLAQEIGDRSLQFEAIHGLGRLNHTINRLEIALTHHHQALQLAIILRQPIDQARAHDGIAHAHHSMIQYEHARRHWQHALDILDALGADHTEDKETSPSTIRNHLVNLGTQETA